MYVAKCLVTKNEDSWLWNIYLRHVHFDLVNKITSKNTIVGLPKKKFSKNKLYNSFQMGKPMRVSFKLKKHSFNFKTS